MQFKLLCAQFLILILKTCLSHIKKAMLWCMPKALSNSQGDYAQAIGKGCWQHLTAACEPLEEEDWVLVYLFPHENTRKNRSCHSHGPYRITSIDDTDLSVAKVYFPQDAMNHYS